MADGSPESPFHVVIDSFETTATPVPVSQYGAWSVGQTGPWSVETTPVVSGETTGTVVVSGFGADWEQELHAMPAGIFVLLAAILLVCTAQLVLQVKH